MNLIDEKINGNNIINVTNSLNAPLLELKIYNNQYTNIPINNELIIYVDKDDTLTEELKQYVFTLTHPLKYFDNVSDEFILKPVFKNNDVTMKCYIKRNIDENELGLYLLEEPIIEELEYQAVTLFEEVNYIYTNYTDVTIDLVYPKNNDINNRFLSNAIYNEQNNNLNNNYIKDIFTYSENGINISGNNLDINCITSKQNNFSLDSEGNLSVNSITSLVETNPQIDYNELFDLIYPIGSIYITTNNTNPSSYFCGIWETFSSGRTLVGIDLEQSEFNELLKTGGNKNHTLSTNEMPLHGHSAYTNTAGAHRHKFKGWWTTDGLGSTTYACIAKSLQADDWEYGPFEEQGAHLHSVTINNTGGGNSHNNLQPYIVVYMWKRIS